MNIQLLALSMTMEAWKGLLDDAVNAAKQVGRREAKRAKATLNPGDAFYEETLRERTRKLEWEVTDLTRLLDRLSEQIESWAAATLPGIKAGFTR